MDICIRAALEVRDPDGNYRITGRIKDMIIRGGENISPREIEEFLYHMPGVKDCSGYRCSLAFVTEMWVYLLFRTMVLKLQPKMCAIFARIKLPVIKFRDIFSL